MAPMRNVYNMVSDGFKYMGVMEEHFIVTIEGSTITIKKDGREEKSEIFLRIENGILRGFDETNDFFTNAAWNRFCQVFEREVSYPDDFYAFLGALANQANRLGTNAWMT
jgi:hypothetical protein